MPQRADKKSNGLDIEEVTKAHTKALDLKDVEIEKLTKQLGQVMQDATLYVQSVKEREGAQEKEAMVERQLMSLLNTIVSQE